MNDAMILNKSKNRVLAHLIFYFIFICAYDVMTYYVLTLDFFANTGFAYVYLGLALAQVLIFLIAFGLLAFLGGRMIKESFSNEDKCCFDPTRLKVVVTLAIATSIDALAIGISFAFVGMNSFTSILSPIVIIG
ncbi:manganese efflux pump, partial [uncultured Dubosiella sp.]|uniref:manganese efflux pump n=1 Tax=uncultured Dubosiella sp. TaxID=1937011 RepID=UPI0025B3C3D3